MKNQLYPWQGGTWRQLQQMRTSMPHAILFHGPSGIGKVALAECFAKSLLCEQILSDGHACGRCISCGWFDSYSHPDYRRLRPEALDAADAQANDDDADDEPAEEKSGTKSKRAPSKIIRISQVRDLSGFANISTHRHGNRVVLLYPAETLNTESSNALLKSLEEPHPGTVFLLVSDNPESLLPTILSHIGRAHV